MKTLVDVLNKIIDVSGYICIAALLLMIINVFLGVFVRYVVFGSLQYFQWITAIDWYNEHLSWLGGVGMQELEWYFFSVMFLLGLGYPLRDNGHVRVDVLYDNVSRTTQAWVNIIGGLIFAIPFSILMFYFSFAFFYDSFQSMENRGDPGSLPRLWPVKLVLPIAFVFFILSVIAVMLKEFQVIKQQQKKTVS